MKKIWLITGVSGGIGREIAIEAAKQGDTVYGILRKSRQIKEFEAVIPGSMHALLSDVTDYESISRLVDIVIEKELRIDVLVNNAGYGLFGSVEEVSMPEARAQMETNFFAALNLTQSILPHMRKQRSGHIFQISSIAGFRGTEGLGIYNASKFALEGFSQALAKEVAGLGICVTLVEPGPFRTDWGGRSAVRSKKKISDYEQTAGLRIKAIERYSGTQVGDPVKAAKLIVEIASSEHPPLHLPLGSLAIDGFREKMAAIEKDIQIWEAKSRNTEY